MTKFHHAGCFTTPGCGFSRPRFLNPKPLPIALSNLVKRIQGSKSQVCWFLLLHYCNLLLCDQAAGPFYCRRLCLILTPVKPQLQPTFRRHHKGVARAGRPPSLLAWSRCSSASLQTYIPFPPPMASLNLPDARISCFDIKVDTNSCFPELLLAVVTVNVAYRCYTLTIGGGNKV
jgi:hypothetical protein